MGLAAPNMLAWGDLGSAGVEAVGDETEAERGASVSFRRSAGGFGPIRQHHPLDTGEGGSLSSGVSLVGVEMEGTRAERQSRSSVTLAVGVSAVGLGDGSWLARSFVPRDHYMTAGVN